MLHELVSVKLKISVLIVGQSTVGIFIETHNAEVTEAEDTSEKYQVKFPWQSSTVISKVCTAVSLKNNSNKSRYDAHCDELT